MQQAEIQQLKDTQIRPLLTKIVQIIRRHVPAETHRLMLCGSWATLTAAPTSDIDVAIVGEEAIGEREMQQIKDALEHLPTLRKIDVIDTSTIEEGYKHGLLKHAEPLD